MSLQVLLSPLRAPAPAATAPVESPTSASFSLPVQEQVAPNPQGAYLFTEPSDASDLNAKTPQSTPLVAPAANDTFLAQLIGASLPELAAAALPPDAHDPAVPCELLPEAPELPLPSVLVLVAPESAWESLGVPDTDFPGLSASNLPPKADPTPAPRGPPAATFGQPLAALAAKPASPTTPVQATTPRPDLLDVGLELAAFLANSLPRTLGLARPEVAASQGPTPAPLERPLARPAAKPPATGAAVKVLATRTSAAPPVAKPASQPPAALPTSAPTSSPLRTFSETPWLEVAPDPGGHLEPETFRPPDADRLGSAAQLLRGAPSARTTLADAAPFRAPTGPTPELSAPVPHDLELEVQQGADSLRLSLTRAEEGYHLSLRGSSLLLQDPAELHAELDRALRQDAEQGLASFDAHADDSPEEDPEADPESPPEESSDPSRLLDRRV